MRVFQMHISRSSSSSSKSTYARYLCESVDCVSVLFALSTLFISIIHIIFHSFAIAVCDGVDDTLQSLCVRASERLHVISQSWKFCFIIYLFSWIKLSLDMWADKKNLSLIESELLCCCCYWRCHFVHSLESQLKFT